MRVRSRVEARLRRKRRVRRKIGGTTERPRLSPFRSLKHIYAQVVDDETGRTLAAASDRDPDLRAALTGRKKKERAAEVGALLARRCLERGIDRVVFDRAGYKYHGRVAALADGARKGGLRF